LWGCHIFMFLPFGQDLYRGADFFDILDIIITSGNQRNFGRERKSRPGLNPGGTLMMRC
jgi:hypothetical protein